jgi:hypothetical protein
MHTFTKTDAEPNGQDHIFNGDIKNVKWGRIRHTA